MASLTKNELISLCEINKDGIYVQKKGQEYINMLKSYFDLDNKNDNPFTIDDVISQPKYEDFSFEGKKDFIKTCILEIEPLTYNPTTNKIKNEKIKVSSYSGEKEKNIFNTSLGVAYLFTVTINNEERIIKIGQTRTTFKERLNSYNCGCVKNWRTASTTNLKLKQSMVVTRLPINVYLFDCNQTETFNWHGIKSVPFASPFSLAVEDIMIKEFIKEFGKKPLVNIQANATTI